MAAPSASWAQTIDNTAALAFGSFAAASGGSVIITTSGSRSQTGGVVLVSSGAGAAAQFAVAGDAGKTYTITLPGNGVVSLASGANTMAVGTFTSSPTPTGTLSGTLGSGLTGSQTLLVGATLTVGSDQPPGSYSGSFSVTVEYN